MQNMKSSENTESFLKAARHCAMQMMENATYIEAQLPMVELPDGIGAKIQTLCASLIGTKHDVMTECFELKEKAGTASIASGLEPRVGRIMRWMAAPIEEMHQVVGELQAASDTDPRWTLGFLLVAESATNILNAFNDAKNTQSLLSSGDTQPPNTPVSCSAGI
jgi:hypothetical protein